MYKVRVLRRGLKNPVTSTKRKRMEGKGKGV
jgi:hypothetical protein